MPLFVKLDILDAHIEKLKLTLQDAGKRFECSTDVRDFQRIVMDNVSILHDLCNKFARELEAKDDEELSALHGDSWGRYMDRARRFDDSNGPNSRTGIDGVVTFFEPARKNQDPTEKIQRKDADIGLRSLDSYR